MVKLQNCREREGEKHLIVKHKIYQTMISAWRRNLLDRQHRHCSLPVLKLEHFYVDPSHHHNEQQRGKLSDLYQAF